MVNTLKGHLDARGLRFGIVVARFNSAVTDRLLGGALRALQECGMVDDGIDVVHVPGAFEVPLVAQKLAQSDRYDAVICLGAVVRGETQHHRYISAAVFDALQHLQVTHQVPVALGILTTENMEQALHRSAADRNNKGFEAALTAVETANLLRELG
jgi:6,7-dimethyl-8-ribityllumazine synthase